MAKKAGNWSTIISSRPFKKPSPHCISPPESEEHCALVQSGDCSIEFEGDTVWMCSHHVLRAIKEIKLYPWWKRPYIRHVYNRYLKELDKVRKIIKNPRRATWYERRTYR